MLSSADGRSRPMGRMIRYILSIIAVTFIFIVPRLSLGAGKPVKTQNGLVAGVQLDHGLEVFKGIPFAAPPVGKLRWLPPQPPSSWQGVRKADAFGPPCMQPPSPKRLGPWTRVFLSKLKASENCLYLNLWTHTQRTRQPLPVMVWIYGGGFTSGAGSVEIYDGSALARQGVVVVNFNYRVGPFGFFSYPGLTAASSHHASGNQGLLDQIAALRWVKRNIRAFGGNPGQVTIFGQSAGAASVWDLMQSPLARGLFERAIIMSGPGGIPFGGNQRSLANAEDEGAKFAARLGAHSLEQLQSVPAQKIDQESGRMQWAPIDDGWVERAGWHPKHEVPVINGMVADDIGIGYYGSGPEPPVTLKTLQRTLRQICGSAFAACQKLYPASNNHEAAAARLAALRDRARVSLYRWGVNQLRLSPQVYIYYFDQKIPWPQHPEYGAFHSSDMPYDFDNLRLMDRPWRPVDFRVAKQMSAYWTGFGKTGDPYHSGLPDWPALKAGDETIMQLGSRMGPMPLAESARMKFWLSHLKKPLGF